MLYAFFLQSKVFLSQESHCSTAILGTLVVTYIVACVMMMTQSFVKPSHFAPLRLKSSRPREYRHNSPQLSTAALLLDYSL